MLSEKQHISAEFIQSDTIFYKAQKQVQLNSTLFRHIYVFNKNIKNKNNGMINQNFRTVFTYAEGNRN